jgi:hypothetical protein
VKEASIGVVGVAFVTILAYSVVANVSIITAISTWAAVFKDVFGLLSVAVEIVIFGGIARTAVYIKKQERIGKYGLIILSVLVLGAVLVVVSAVPGGFSVPPLT